MKFHKLVSASGDCDPNDRIDVFCTFSVKWNEKYHKAKEIDEKMGQHFDTKALSYSEVCYWIGEFARAAIR